MPELPEVETVRRGLAASLEGARIDRVTVRLSPRRRLRLPLPAGFAAALEGRRLTAARRRGKYLLLDLEKNRAPALTLLLHLGMSGRVVIAGPRPEKTPLPPPGIHDHVILNFADGAEMRFTDPRRFGLMTLAPRDEIDRHALLAEMGPEPLEDDFSAEILCRAFAGRRQAVKCALMDQRLVAGIGNIYASESLYYAGISPRRRAETIGPVRGARLVAAIREVLTAAIASGGSSLRDHVATDGSLGYFQHRFAVYDRAGRPCPTCDCGGGVRQFAQAGRATYYCPRHQR